jgi:hypothetical protein
MQTGHPSPETIKQKRDSFSYLLSEIDKELQTKKSLKRHDWWRKSYYEEPYLIDIHDQYVKYRFIDLMNNITTLTEGGLACTRFG